MMKPSRGSVVSFIAGTVATVAGIAIMAAATPMFVRETITINKGDTIQPKYSISTDTVLQAIPGAKIVARGCGFSHAFLRLWHGNTILSSDTVNVFVSCPAPDTVPTRVDVFNHFQLVGDSIVGVKDTMLAVGQTRCVYVVALNKSNVPLTGKAFSLHSGDSSVVRIGGTLPDSAAPCPDTTVSPANMRQWAYISTTSP